MQVLFITLQQSVTNIEEKIKSAPDSGYKIGVVIGSYLPFLLLVGLAYLMYYKSKKNKSKSDV